MSLPPEERDRAWADAVSKLYDDRSTSLRSAFDQAANQSPDRAADVLRIADRNKVAPDLVERNYDLFKQTDAAQTTPYARLLTETPGLADWIRQRPEHAALAKDDLDQMGYLHWLATAPKQALDRGKASVELAHLQTRSIFSDLGAKDLQRVDELKAQLAAQGGSLGTQGFWSPRSTAITGLAEFLPMLTGVWTTTQARALEAGSAVALGTAVGTGGLGAPLVLPAAGVAAAVGGIEGGLEEGFKLFAGPAYEHFRTVPDELGHPLSPAVAKGAAIAVGALNAGVGPFLLGTVTKLLPGMGAAAAATKLVTDTVQSSPVARNALGRLVLNYAGQMTKTTAAMMGQQAVQIIVGDLAQKASGQPFAPIDWLAQAKDVGEAGLSAAQSFALVNLAGPGTQLLRDLTSARTATAAQAYIEARGKAVADSNVYQRSPEKMQQYLAHLDPDATVNLPVEPFVTYWQSKGVDPAEKATELTGDPKALANALVTHEDLSVPAAKYDTLIGATEHATFFNKEVRLQPDMMNGREVEGFTATQKAAFDKDIEAMAAEEAAKPTVEWQTAEERTAASIKAVGEQVRTMSAAAGFDKAAAEAHGKLFEARFGTLAQALKVDPLALFQKYGLQVERPLLERAAAGPGVTELTQRYIGQPIEAMLKPADVETLTAKGYPVDGKTPITFVGWQETGDPAQPFYAEYRVGQYNFSEMSLKKLGIEPPAVPERKTELYQSVPREPKVYAGPERRTASAADMGISERRYSELLKKFGGTQEEQPTLPEAGAVRQQEIPTPQFEAPFSLTGEAATVSGKQGKLFQPMHLAAPFYSALTKAAETLPQAKGTPEQMLAMLKKTPGVKQEEIQWSGVEDWLKQQKGSVTKEALTDYLRANQLQVQEVTKGAPNTDLAAQEAYRAAEAEEERLAGERAVAKLAFERIDGETDPEAFDRAKRAFDKLTGEWRTARNRRSELAPAAARTAIKFEKYTLPGGENYRELLLTLPTADFSPRVAALRDQLENFVAQPTPRTPEEGAARNAEYDRLYAEFRAAGGTPKRPEFRGGHFEEPNVVAHIRFNERTDADGKPVLFIEEVQSDWHQKGRKEGYRAKNYEALQAEWNALYKEGLTNPPLARQQELSARSEELKKQMGTIPDAPFKTSWAELSMKRMVRYAAEHGFDRIAWTTGEQQNDRYDLSKAVDSIKVTDQGNDKYTVAAERGGESVLYKVNVPSSELAGMIGKDLTDKALGDIETKAKAGSYQKAVQYSGVDLKVGGEGMKGFYDKILPDFLRKFGKKFGATVGDTDLMIEPTVTRQQLKIPGAGEQPVPVHSFDLTPDLKDAALNQGFALFQTEGTRGSIRWGADRQFTIDLGPKANLSTFLHESGHLFLETFGDAADQLTAIPEADRTPEQSALIKDYATVLKRLGVEDRSGLGTAQHEQFAKEFEAYLREGKAPTVALRTAFARFRAWLMNLYTDVRAQLGIHLNDEIRGVFDRMLATDDAIQTAEDQAPIRPIWATQEESKLNNQEWAAYQKTLADAHEQRVNELQSTLIKEWDKEQTAFWTTERAKMRDDVVHEFEQDPAFIALSALRKNQRPDGTPLPDEIQTGKLDLASLERRFGKAVPDAPTMTKAERAELPKGASTEPYIAPGSDTVARLKRRGLVQKDGINPDVAAERFGYESGDALVHVLLDTPPWTTAVETETERRMRDNYGNPQLAGGLADEAEATIVNNGRSQVVEAELKALAKQRRAVAPFVAAERKTLQIAGREARAAIAEGVPTIAQARAVAQSRVGGLTVAQLLPTRFEVAARVASREAFEAAQKQDVETAISAKTRELVAVETARAVREAGAAVDQGVQDMKGFFQPDAKLAKSRNMDFVTTARNIAAAYLYPTGSTKRMVALADLEKIRAYDNDLYSILQGQIDDATVNAQSYKNLTYEQFIGLRDTVMSLWTMARRSEQIKIDGALRDREGVRDELIAGLQGVGKPPGHEWTKTEIRVLGATAALTRVEHYLNALDANNPNGLFQRVIWHPIKEAATAFRLQKDTELARFVESTKPIEASLTADKIAAPELGYTFAGKAELLGMLLHTGNASNLKKLVLGYGWGAIGPDGEVDSSKLTAFLERAQRQGLLTKADYDFAQATWDQFEHLKPALQRAHKEMYGHYFAEVTAQPFTTPFGDYAGGYMPARVDPLKVPTSLRGGTDAIANGESAYAFPTTGRGATKSRVEGYNKPLALDLALVPSHLDWALRFIHLEPRIKDVGRLLLDPQMKAAFEVGNRQVVNDLLLPWLSRTARQVITERTKKGGGEMLDSFARGLRTRTSLNALGLNAVNMMHHAIGFTLSATKVPWADLGRGLFSYAKGPHELADYITSRSDYMRTHTSSQIAELQQTVSDLLTQPSQYEKVRDFAQKNGMFFSRATQHMLDLFVWKGAEDDALRRGLSDQEAIRSADSAVRLTLGGAAPEDVTSFETSTPFMRLFTMYYGYFNNEANLLGSELQGAVKRLGFGPKMVPRALYVTAMTLTLPAILYNGIRMGMAGEPAREPGEEDEYLWPFLRFFFGGQLKQIGLMVPGLGSLGGAIAAQLNNQTWDDDIRVSPALSALQASGKGIHSIYQQEESWRQGTEAPPTDVKDVLTLIGMISGMPVGAIAKPVQYAHDVATGKTAPPETPIEAGQGLISGRGQPHP